MNAFDEILLGIAFAACFGIAICLLLLLSDYLKQRREISIPQPAELTPAQSRKRAA